MVRGWYLVLFDMTCSSQVGSYVCTTCVVCGVFAVQVRFQTGMIRFQTGLVWFGLVAARDEILSVILKFHRPGCSPGVRERSATVA